MWHSRGNKFTDIVRALGCGSVDEICKVIIRRYNIEVSRDNGCYVAKMYIV